ncbi:sulfate transporter CysZ [Legionella sp. 29fVS95]|uniref:sulfate transporter CysZ n=1 Tax=Legionella sp. 29fVS95 TaxID=3402813 RepID=UPI003AF6597D
MKSFFTGISCFFLGLKALNQQGLRRFVVLPLLFNFLLYGGIAYLSYHYLFAFTDYYIKQLPHWLSFLSSVFTLLFFLLFVLVFLSTFSVVANVFAAPFNGLLSEKAQQLLYGIAVPERPLGTMVVQSIKRQGQFIFYYLPRFIGLCLLFLIPPLHPFLPFLWFIFNAWMLSIQYQDFAMDNNLVDFNTMRKQIKNSKRFSMGFGFIISLLSFIPFLNILIMPAAVIGGTLMWYKRQQNKATELL